MSFIILGNSFLTLQTNNSSTAQGAPIWKLSLSRCALEPGEDLQPRPTHGFLQEKSSIKMGREFLS